MSADASFRAGSTLAASRVVSDDGQWLVEGADDEHEEVGFSVDPSPSWRSPLCSSTLVAGVSLASAAGPEVRTFSSWKPDCG